jgi:opacity protein-like surface antigen
MKTTVYIAASLAFAAASPVAAGGLNEPVPQPVIAAPAPVVVPAGTDWTGFYLGGAVGTGDLTVGTNLATPTLETDAMSYGLYGGYNYDLGSFVIGGEASYDIIDLDVDDTLDNRVFRIGARAGYDAGAFMPYATVGFANLSTDAFGTDQSDNGYYYGAGVDVRVTDSITAGLQYIRHEFSDFDDGGSDIQADLLQLRAAYNF